MPPGLLFLGLDSMAMISIFAQNGKKNTVYNALHPLKIASMDSEYLETPKMTLHSLQVDYSCFGLDLLSYWPLASLNINVEKSHT